MAFKSIREMKNCCILGLGYIGLPTAAVLANSGFIVKGVDINETIVRDINKGKIHIYEKGLEDLVKKAIDNKALTISDKPSESEVFIIAVPTPFHNKKSTELKKPNLDYVFEAAKTISKYIKKENLIILESTSPVGTSEKVANLISKYSNLEESEINIAYCPERVLPGNIIFELKNNDRVIGGRTAKASNMAKQVYRSFCKGKLIITNDRTAELVKLTENSFRDVNLAFANELSMICDEYNVKARELISIANHHPRVNILNPGCGVGGHCIAVDPWFLISALPEEANLIKKAREVNIKKTNWVLDKIKNKVDVLKRSTSKDISIGILGLTFKQDVDDIRESPAMLIAEKLIKQNYNIYPCDPNIKNKLNFNLFSLEETLTKSDLIIILVPHKEFKKLDLIKKNFLDFSGIF